MAIAEPWAIVAAVVSTGRTQVFDAECPETGTSAPFQTGFLCQKFFEAFQPLRPLDSASVKHVSGLPGNIKIQIVPVINQLDQTGIGDWGSAGPIHKAVVTEAVIRTGKAPAHLGDQLFGVAFGPHVQAGQKNAAQKQTEIGRDHLSAGHIDAVNQHGHSQEGGLCSWSERYYIA